MTVYWNIYSTRWNNMWESDDDDGDAFLQFPFGVKSVYS